MVRRNALAVLCGVAASLLAASSGYAASFVYLSNVIPGYGMWTTNTQNTENYNRMSVNSGGVGITYCTNTSCPAMIYAVGFAQQSLPGNATVSATCQNRWQQTTGYCAYYDNEELRMRQRLLVSLAVGGVAMGGAAWAIAADTATHPAPAAPAPGMTAMLSTLDTPTMQPARDFAGGVDAQVGGTRVVARGYVTKTGRSAVAVSIGDMQVVGGCGPLENGLRVCITQHRHDGLLMVGTAPASTATVATVDATGARTVAPVTNGAWVALVPSGEVKAITGTDVRGRQVADGAPATRTLARLARETGAGR